jgi:glyoxylase-like metal-dependent hydrolase (beta-lactamase superfamily II)
MKSPKLISVVMLTAGLGLSSIAMAEGLAQTAVTKANDIIDAVLEAYGGADALSDLTVVSMRSTGKNVAVGQSRKPGEPFDRNDTTGRNYIDYENKIFVSRTDGLGGGNQFDFGQTINGEDSYTINYIGEFATHVAEPDFNTTAGPFIRVTSALLVKQLQDRRHTSHWLGVDDVDGRPHDVITLVMDVGPGLSLYFDKESRMLSKAERILPPFGVVAYRYRDHKIVDGISFNTDFELLLNGAHNLSRYSSDIAINQARKGITDLPKGFRVDPAGSPDELTSNKVDEGVYLIGGGGAYSLFVEMEDFVLAAGATAGVAARIAELRKSIPEKPIRYALLTHHHNDHIPGAADYVATGSTLLTVAPNEAVVRAVSGVGQGKIEFIDGERTISDGKRDIEIRNIGPTPHAENLLVVYLPAEGIVFEADHFPLPLNGTLPPPSNNTRAFVEAVKDWDFDRLVGAHSPVVGSKSDLMGVVSGKLATR